jgi:hypothetical protein
MVFDKRDMHSGAHVERRELGDAIAQTIWVVADEHAELSAGAKLLFGTDGAAGTVVLVEVDSATPHLDALAMSWH